MNTNKKTTIDPDQVQQFSNLANDWWEPKGKFKPLHKFNPIRLTYIRDQLCRHFGRDDRSLKALDGLKILDVGCGGGLISEPLCRMGALVTGIDASSQNIEIAAHHARMGNLKIDYISATPEELITSKKMFDVVIALEVVEHVKDIDLFIDSCAALTSKGGVTILATLNRTTKSFLLAIVGAEYLLRWLPRGTHDWSKFVRPSEIFHALRRNNITTKDISGFNYNILTDTWSIRKNPSVNYVILGVK
tara:strand:- start:318 stop:1058 length:741 start_codon:yes stop_codon:yes gene_type:complete